MCVVVDGPRVERFHKKTKTALKTKKLPFLPPHDHKVTQILDHKHTAAVHAAVLHKPLSGSALTAPLTRIPRCVCQNAWRIYGRVRPNRPSAPCC